MVANINFAAKTKGVNSKIGSVNKDQEGDLLNKKRESEKERYK